MNERIKELAKQAGYRDIFDNDTKARARLEKYTELIVQECAHIAWLYDEPKLSGHGAIIANSIKKQFGVEE